METPWEFGIWPRMTCILSSALQQRWEGTCYQPPLSAGSAVRGRNDAVFGYGNHLEKSKYTHHSTGIRSTPSLHAGFLALAFITKSWWFGIRSILPFNTSHFICNCAVLQHTHFHRDLKTDASLAKALWVYKLCDTSSVFHGIWQAVSVEGSLINIADLMVLLTRFHSVLVVQKFANLRPRAPSGI